MIPVATIKQIFNELSEYLNISIIREDQRGNPSGYPFASYKNTTINEESAHQNIKVIEENETDPTSANITMYEQSDNVFSISFMDKDRIDRIQSYASQALQWFKSVAGTEYGNVRGVNFHLISNAIEDRSSFLDAYWENKVGFDVRFLYQGAYTQTIEGVEHIYVTPTVDDEEKSVIIFDEV